MRLSMMSFKFWRLIIISKIQLVVYYQRCILIGWATTGLYVTAH